MSRKALRRGFLRVTMPALFLVAVTAAILLVRSGLQQSATQVEPAAAHEKAPAKPVKPIYYRIRGGDTLDLVALRFDTTVDRLLELNPGVNPHLLKPGQKIRVR